MNNGPTSDGRRSARSACALSVAEQVGTACRRFPLRCFSNFHAGGKRRARDPGEGAEGPPKSLATMSTIWRAACCQPEPPRRHRRDAAGSGFRAHLAAALAKALIQRGSIPILINTGQTEDELLAAQKMLIGHRAEATIILSGSPPANFVELAHRNGQPLVVIGRTGPDADHVRAGNSEASRKAATAFFDQGRRRLAVAASHSATSSIAERETAFVAAARHSARRSRSAAERIPTTIAALLPRASSSRRPKDRTPSIAPTTKSPSD